MNKIKTVLLAVLIVFAGLFVGAAAWLVANIMGCFKECSSDAAMLLPYFFLFAAIIISPQLAYFYYRYNTGRPPNSLRKNYLITGLILLLAFIGVFTAGPVTSSIQKAEYSEKISQLSFDVYKVPATSMTYRLDDDRDPSHYKADFDLPPQYSGQIRPASLRVVGGEYDSSVKEVLGNPPCNLNFTVSHLTGIPIPEYRLKEVVRKECDVVGDSGFYVLEVEDSREYREMNTFYTSHAIDKTLLVFYGTLRGDKFTFVKYVQQYIDGMEKLSTEDVVKARYPY